MHRTLKSTVRWLRLATSESELFSWARLIRSSLNCVSAVGVAMVIGESN